MTFNKNNLEDACLVIKSFFTRVNYNWANDHLGKFILTTIWTKNGGGAVVGAV